LRFLPRSPKAPMPPKSCKPHFPFPHFPKPISYCTKRYSKSHFVQLGPCTRPQNKWAWYFYGRWPRLLLPMFWTTIWLSWLPPGLGCAPLTSLFQLRGACLGAVHVPMYDGLPGTNPSMSPLRAWLYPGRFWAPIRALDPWVVVPSLPPLDPLAVAAVSCECLLLDSGSAFLLRSECQ
jgi:hypothetical protein